MLITVIQKRESEYKIDDQVFLMKHRLKDLAINGEKYSKQQLLDQIFFLNSICEEI
jgi:hypothetical protein